MEKRAHNVAAKRLSSRVACRVSVKNRSGLDTACLLKCFEGASPGHLEVFDLPGAARPGTPRQSQPASVKIRHDSRLPPGEQETPLAALSTNVLCNVSCFKYCKHDMIRLLCYDNTGQAERSRRFHWLWTKLTWDLTLPV
ncbi:hypothetical protein EYF80_001997 [Liparis tanakae]|uniref:Uncharacterized protein n=1 Tax=Liparis tanakae TaxID=230148 RepID=A0A4Z2JBY1_9TELE|nr:hypothetical protein EYF80_001997 [Liparis tanakae]